MKSDQSFDTGKKTNWGLLGAVGAAIIASVCCVGPFALLLLGIGGAWVGSLAALEPYRPIFIGLTLLFLGWAFYRVYQKPKAEDCEPGSYCANPRSDRINKISLWVVTILIMGLIAFPYVMPRLTGTPTIQQPVNTEKAVLSVDNMTCSGCVLTVTRSLKNLDGVVDARVTLNPPQAVVEFDPDKVSVEDLTRATLNSGYPSQIKSR